MRVCVVGSGMHFVSGISYYTYYLARTLNERHQVSAILMRRLIPRRWYPGRDRVGAPITTISVSDVVRTYDGVDWWGLPSVARAIRFLRAQQPDVLVLQWWSASVLPWYLLLARQAGRQRALLVVELHELQDTGEARLPFVGAVGSAGLRALCRRASACVVHSSWDRDRLAESMGVDPAVLHVIGHGPYDHRSLNDVGISPGIIAGTGTTACATPGADAGDSGGLVNILFFGTIRPYKGLEHLVEAFDRLPRDAGQRWRLTIVGETWEEWTLPLQLVARSAHHADIEVVNRYVTDSEADEHFTNADMVALPYLRSSASGPLAIAKARGLPVVVTEVGGLTEAAVGYTGAVLVCPGDVDDLARGLVDALALRGVAHRDPASWEQVADAYEAVFASLPLARR